MTNATIHRIRVEKGQCYWVDFFGSTRHAKVLDIIDQNGAKMVRFRIGWPIIGHTVVESLSHFWQRMVKI